MDRYEDEIYAELKKDYLSRAEKRRAYEGQWRLNMNFAAGDQFCVAADGGISETDPDYYWQEREAFNHIASIVETRLAKLGRVRPMMSVRPASGDGDDVYAARASTKILASAANALDMPRILERGTVWSEICGSVFYKVSWDPYAGRSAGEREGKTVYEGDVCVQVVPPFEIYPDDPVAADIEECKSILHARAVDTDAIYQVFGVRVEAEQDLPTGYYRRETAEGRALVIERYTLPTPDKPQGEYVAGAGGRILYFGSLPYLNGAGGTPGLPFVKQDSITRAGCFFGVSPVERAIPIQRAYNAVKNRKHEFMNRISAGVVAVEDGSVDARELAAEGLPPGKVIVYRQGCNPPRLLEAGHVPGDFSAEEDRLLNEFVTVSGVSEIMRSSSIPSALTSGVALQLLIEQDDTRLNITAENVRQAAKKMAAHILRLYKQFALAPRLVRITGKEGDIELMKFSSSDISCDDIVFDSGNELSETPASKQNMLFELLKSGLLYDERGRLDETTRYKLLDVLGYGGWERVKDVKTLHYNRAERENESQAEIKEYDDHEAHIAAHTKYLLSKELSARADAQTAEKALAAHIREHKKYMRLTKEAEVEKE